ncbi:hypothetical protein Purlil1_13827 [Purpureocillium lilacinum]|uniref:CHAT domain-containing protein n=1 Tax=Purpureocillium lilacinum TaxID=33203 RepID=A0ABR0BD51_PURLI|nr:hypothetical protein Purlil1_13827 [Purpureocillium lilacinum]
MADLNRAVDVAGQAADITPRDHPKRVGHLRSLSYWLGKRSKRTGSMDDLNRAVDIANQAVDAAPQGHPDRAAALNGLGTQLVRRFEMTGSMDDLNRAVDVAGEAVDATPQNHRNRAAWLNNLGVHLKERHDRTGSMDDLIRAVDIANQAVDAAPQGHPDRAAALNGLGTQLVRRFKMTGSMDDLNRAVDVAGEAVDATPQNHRNRAVLLGNLGNWLGMRFEWTGSMDDLNRAVDITGQAVDATTDGHAYRADMLNGFSHWLGSRFERTGSMDDLNLAVDIASQAMDTTFQGQYGRGNVLNTLGLWLGKRFERTGSMDDLNRAISITSRAVDATPQDDPNRAVFLATLGHRLGRRFERTGSMDDLNHAVDIAGQAVDTTPQGHINRAAVLNGLGTWLARRFEWTGSKEDLNRATYVAAQAVDATPEDHPDRAIYLNNFGNRLGRRFELTGSMDDINGAVDLAGRAVDATPQNHPNRAGCFDNLANRLGMRFERTRSLEDLDRQLSSCKKGWHCRMATPPIRIRLARQAAQLLATRLDWEGSHQLLQAAINLLPKISPRWLTSTDKQHMLADFAGLASEAASVALNARKDAYDALQVLELGRGVIANLLMEMRGDVSHLQKQHPDLANEFISCRDDLDSLGDSQSLLPATDEASSWESRAKRRREADMKFDELISIIRALPGFQNFLLPATADELMAAASLGPVVVINLSPYRCDAFLIETEHIQVLELPGLTIEGVQERAQKLRSVPQAAPHYAIPLLEWLWDVVARPVLDALGFHGPIPDDNWPRVWWIPTGVLSQLPLHAAGYHTKGGHDTVLDRVMSSYASSVKALIHGRRFDVQRSVGTFPGDALLVGMRETPELSENRVLSFVTQEVAIVQQLCLSLGLRPIRPTLRKDDVLNHLQSCRFFHFAGHGLSHPGDPSQSCLLLEDWQTKPLTVGDIRDHKLQDTPPFLGFLSACSTGANGVDKLVDEGIHLASAFQLSGFRHVVGTLWEVSDQHCVDVARVLYETMRDEGMTDAAVCRGLHRAVRALRNGDMDAGSTSRGNSPAGSADVYNRTDVVAATSEMAEDGAQTSIRAERDPGRVRRKKRQDMSLFWAPYVHFGV